MLNEETRRKPKFNEGFRRDDKRELSVERGKRRHMLKIRVGNDPDRLGRLNLQLLLNLVRCIVMRLFMCRCVLC